MFTFSLSSGRPAFISVEDARQRARRALPRMVFDVIDGAAGREFGADANCADLARIRLQSRVLGDVSRRSQKTRMLGTEFDHPFGIAPMGTCNLARPGADLALARAAKRANMPLCVSTGASTAIETMMEASEGRAWFQLYAPSTAESAFRLVGRARAAGCRHLVLTADVPQLGRRYRDMRNGFRIPLRIGPRQAVDFALHPRWSLATLAAGAPKPVHFGREGFDRNANRATADWDFLDRLRDRWTGTLTVKGVMSADDALRICDAGADAVWVSNHGGRQMESAQAACRALPAIREAVGPDYPLIFDSGVRSGEDIVKALALGADLAMLGRPFLYAAAAGGARTIEAMTDTLAAEIDIAMAQIGVTEIANIGRDSLAAP